MHAKFDDRIRRGAAAAVLHVAFASDSTLFDLARELVAVDKAIAARLPGLPAGGCLRQTFGRASLRRDVAQFMHQRAIADALHEVRESIDFVDKHHGAECAEYKKLLMAVSSTASEVVKTGSRLRRLVVRRSLILALERMRAETASADAPAQDSTERAGHENVSPVPITAERRVRTSDRRAYPSRPLRERHSVRARLAWRSLRPT